MVRPGSIAASARASDVSKQGNNIASVAKRQTHHVQTVAGLNTRVGSNPSARTNHAAVAKRQRPPTQNGEIRGFESHRAAPIMLLRQAAKASVLHTDTRGFESLREHQTRARHAILSVSIERSLRYRSASSVGSKSAVRNAVLMSR